MMDGSSLGLHFLSYLNKTGLTAEEAMLLYTVYIQKELPASRDLLQQLNQYYDKFTYYDQGGQPTAIPWSRIVSKLEREGYLILYPGYNRVGADKKFRMHFKDMEVTDKFKATILDADREKWWDMFLDLYGVTIWVQGKEVSTILPDKGESLEQLKELFWHTCGNGSLYKIGELFEITQKYKDQIGINTKMNRYLKGFDAIKLTLARKDAEASKWNQGY